MPIPSKNYLEEVWKCVKLQFTLEVDIWFADIFVRAFGYLSIFGQVQLSMTTVY